MILYTSQSGSHGHKSELVNTGQTSSVDAATDYAVYVVGLEALKQEAIRTFTLGPREGCVCASSHRIR